MSCASTSSRACCTRGWSYTLQGAWDSFNTPRLALRGHDLEAEFWLTVLDEETAGTGVFTHIGTDQVRFVRPDDVLVPLEDVPPLVSSEVMRDVGLFAGVCSAGNDPEWADSGDQPAGMRAYWGTYAFGEPSATARTRRDLLERLPPALKIADRCRLDVRDGSERRPETFLPFEDTMLSTILSKALLPAGDRRIEDPAIVSQLGRSSGAP